MNTIGNRTIQDVDLKDLQYTEMVIKECLRLFPTVAYTKRELDENINLGKTFFIILMDYVFINILETVYIIF